MMINEVCYIDINAMVGIGSIGSKASKVHTETS